jgi:hypothetical protein
MVGTLIEHEPFNVAKHAGDAASMSGAVIVRVFAGTPPFGALDYHVRADGTLIPPGGYEAVIEDGIVTGMRKVPEPAQTA